jgi:hypothetical protein
MLYRPGPGETVAARRKLREASPAAPGYRDELGFGGV